MTASSSIVIFGLEVPDAGPFFFAVLAVHVLAAGTCVVAGALAATARKQFGRHPRAGSVYWVGLAVVFASATVMAVIRWEHNWHLFLVACAAFGCATAGRHVRRRRAGNWMAWHGVLMSSSYVLLLTGFYVDNGPQLPLWDRLPPIAYWTLPAAVGAPITFRALKHNGALSRRRPAERNGRTRQPSPQA